MQRNTPALFGMSPRSAQRTDRNAFDFVKDSVELIAARTCGEVPDQSTSSEPPSRTVMATASGTGASERPSLSMWSTKRYVPLGQVAISARAMRSA